MFGENEEGVSTKKVKSIKTVLNCIYNVALVVQLVPNKNMNHYLCSFKRRILAYWILWISQIAITTRSLGAGNQPESQNSKFFASCGIPPPIRGQNWYTFYNLVRVPELQYIVFFVILSFSKWTNGLYEGLVDRIREQFFFIKKVTSLLLLDFSRLNGLRACVKD